MDCSFGYHPKGYLFEFDDYSEVIIGSSNITRYALLKSDIINLYANKLNFAIERRDMDYDLSVANVKLNFMQRRALKELNRYRAIGTNHALVVAAAEYDI